MEDFKLDIFIVLMLLEKNDSFKNNYSLNRALERQFNIFPVSDLKEEMLHKGYITRDSNNVMYTFEITTFGKEYLKRNFENGKVLVVDNYPDKHEFISALFDGLVCPL